MTDARGFSRVFSPTSEVVSAGPVNILIATLAVGEQSAGVVLSIVHCYTRPHNLCTARYQVDML